MQAVTDSAEFVRLVVTSGDEELAVDFGVDADPLLPPTTTFLGPSIPVEENAGRKMLALFTGWAEGIRTQLFEPGIGKQSTAPRLRWEMTERRKTSTLRTLV